MLIKLALKPTFKIATLETKQKKEKRRKKKNKQNKRFCDCLSGTENDSNDRHIIQV